MDQADIESGRAAVKAWVEEHVGPGRRFASYRQWCEAAGLSPGGLDTLKRGSIPKAPTLAKLAGAAEEEPDYVLGLAGYGSRESSRVALSPRERRLLAAFRDLRDRDQAALVRSAEALRRYDED